jgi:shikimate kinase
MNNVFVILGVSRAGKTTLAREIGKRLDFTVVDMDDLMVQSWHGQGSNRDCFFDLGALKFRQLEERVYQDFMPENNSIISIGGGALLNNICAKQVVSWGVCGWLYVPKSIIFSRWGKAAPLNIAKSEWGDFYQQRSIACAKYADLIWDNNVDLVIQQIKNISKYCEKIYGE